MPAEFSRSLNELFKTVKSESLPAIWSQGVKLARAGAVTLDRGNDAEMTLRVSAPGQAAYSTTILYTRELEWTCDCTSPTDPCKHVTAAVIAAHQAEQSGSALAAARSTGAQIVYVVRPISTGQVALDRFIEHAAERHPLEGTLTGAQNRFSLHPGPEDFVVERFVATARRGVLLMDAWVHVLESLRDAHVELGGRSVRTQSSPIQPAVRLYDDGAEVVLEILRDPSLDDVLGFGLARCADTVRPLGLTELAGLRWERLPLSRRFAKEELVDLTTRVLPELEAKVSVRVETKRLPRLARSPMAPRLIFEVGHGGHALSVLPLLVYGDPPQARIDGGKLVHLSGDVPERDEVAERKLIARLRDELNLALGRRVDFDGQDAQRFASKLRAFQESVGSSGLPLVHDAPLEPRIVVDGDKLTVEFLATESPEGARGDKEPAARADAQTVLHAWRDGLSLVPLSTGGWAPLPVNWLERYGERIADLLAARNAEGKVARPAVFALAALCEELEQPRPPSFDELQPLIENFEKIPEAHLPEDLRADLRPYQRVGVNWLSFLRRARLGAVLADDMGLGKTLQTLCVLPGGSLVVCPKSVAHNWESEAHRFRPGLTTNLYQGQNRKLVPEADLTITTYAILRLDAEKLSAHTWNAIVLDEAQAIKNPDSQVSRAAYQLRTEFPVALSGTPLENRLEELWSLLNFTHRGLLGGRSSFRDRYSTPIDQGNAERLADLRRKIKPFVLRRLKRDVAPELPPRTDMVLEVDLEPSERDLYSAVHAATRTEVLERLQQGGNVMRVLEALLRLRQAACHPQLVPGQQAATSSKIDALIENLDQVVADGHKALVFSQWTGFLDLVEPHLREAGIGFTRLDGSTANRGSVVASFQADSGPPVLLTSLKAGGTGLNLTAADHVFLMDPWWNPAAEDQAADRAHRIGQERPVIVYRLIAKDTVEERILALQVKKRELADAALEGTGRAGGITKEDLLELLG